MLHFLSFPIPRHSVPVGYILTDSLDPTHVFKYRTFLFSTQHCPDRSLANISIESGMVTHAGITQPATDLPEGAVTFLFTDHRNRRLAAAAERAARELRRVAGRAPPFAENCFRELGVLLRDRWLRQAEQEGKVSVYFATFK